MMKTMSETLPAVPTSTEIDTIGRIVKSIGDTEFVPKPLRGRPGACLGAILYGRELGFGLMVSLREVHVIEGSPSLSATAILGRIRAAGHSVRLEEGAEQCVAHGKRADTGDEHTVVWTMKDAEAAKLLNKDNWQKYRRAMLRSRAVTELARALFSDTFAGMSVYTPEEVGAADTDAAGVPVSEETQKDRLFRQMGALIDQLDRNERTPPPDGHESWDAYSKAVAWEQYGVKSRADLTVEQLEAHIERLDVDSVPFA